MADVSPSPAVSATPAASPTVPHERGPDRTWAWLLAAATPVFLVTAAIFALRLTEVVRHGDLYPTTGGEAPQIYSVWKAQRGLPVYEPFCDHNTSGSYFNPSFYFFYATVLKGLGITGAGLVLGGRLLTLAVGAVGAVLTCGLMRRLAGGHPGARESAFFAAMAALFWFGSIAVGWFLLLVRPDIAALTCAVAGLWLYVEANARRSAGLALAASLAFFAGWSFKQATVGLLTGVSLHALIAGRDVRRAAALILPCAALMAATLLLGGPAYRYNTLTLEASLPLDSNIAVYLFQQNIKGHLLIWGVLLAALVGSLRRGAAPVVSGDLGPVAFAAAFTMIWAFFTSGRVGSSKNHLFEMTLAATIFATALLARAIRRPGGLGVGATAGVALLTLSMAIPPGLQLLRPNQYGKITMASDAEYKARATLAASLERFPRPLLARDEMLALPWHSSGGRYPAYMLDVLLYDPALVNRLVDERFFGTLVVAPWDELYRRAEQAGYRVEPPIAGAEGVPERVLTRREAPASATPDGRPGP